MSSNSNKLELKITTDGNGKEIDITNLSLTAAKSLNEMLFSLIKIAEETPNGNDLRIKVVPGSAVVIAEGEDTILEKVKGDFLEVTENKSTNREIVQYWRNIQSLISKNGLNYEVNFYKTQSDKESYLDKLKNTKTFRVKVQRKSKDFELVFLKGKLIENGGQKPNLHVLSGDKENIVSCTEEIAKRLNTFLYNDVFLSAWKRKADMHKDKFIFCDSYVKDEDFNEFKDFIESHNDLNESDEYVSIHERIVDYIDSQQIGKIKKIMRLYNHESSDVGSYKTILAITKHISNDDTVKSLRENIKKLLDSKLRKI
jgi:hypothetical protein